MTNEEIKKECELAYKQLRKLDRFYKRAGLICDSGRVKVPKDIYDKVKILNYSYKTHDNQLEE